MTELPDDAGDLIDTAVREFESRYPLIAARVRAEAVAGERQRIKEAVRAEMLAVNTRYQGTTEAAFGYVGGLDKALTIAAGSVPVATPEPERNPFLPRRPADELHSFQGPADLGGNSRCRFCGAYKGSDEARSACEGEFKQSGKMRSWARRRWDELKESGPVATPTEPARAAIRTPSEAEVLVTQAAIAADLALPGPPNPPRRIELEPSGQEAEHG